MNKEECRLQIYKSADLFKENFVNRNLLLLYQEKPNRVLGMETIFQSNNFLHLTGIIMRDKQINAEEFYHRCIHRRLGLPQFEMKADGTTEMKMSILPGMLSTPNLSAKMLGDFKGQRVKLITHRLVGGVRGNMGFIEAGDRYRPNTVIKDDIRDSVKSAKRILAIYRKGISEEKYQDRIYLAKKVDFNSLRIPDDYSYLQE